MERIAAETFARMAKRLLVPMAVLAAMLAASVPAFAQEQTSATGVLLAGLPADVGTNGTHSITDEASGTVYALASVGVGLDAYVGERVTVYGTLTSGEAGSDNPGPEGTGTLPSIVVAGVEPADGPPGGGPSPQNRTATFDFELTVEGMPPEGARFFGSVPAEGCISVPLTDSDGDGVFTGSLDVPRFAPGPVPPDAEPVSLPVQIVQADSGAGPCNPTTVIRDFGTVPADDATFGARANFNDNGGGTTTPETSNSGGTDGGDGPGGGGSNNSGSSGSSGGANNGDSSGSGGSGNDAASSGSPGGVTSGIRDLLPSTGGGVALWVLGAGILLIGGGLLVRKLAR
jgi:uncharacterized membrane protein YgcG